MKRWVLLVFVLILVLNSGFAGNSKNQNKHKPFVLFTNVDLMSKHVWRGGTSGTLPTIEPMLELSHGKFTFGAWAAATFDGDYRELDLYAIYTSNRFSVGVFDYYCPPEKFWQYEYLNFQSTETFHLFSIDANYTLSARVPIKLTGSVMLGGMDYNPITEQNFYSTYLEASYTKKWNAFSVSLSVGGTTHKGIYAAKAALINTEMVVKNNFKINKFNLPVYAKAIYNPYSNTPYFLVGISLNRSFKF